MHDAHIIMVIDRSGSMQAVKADAEGGIKTFLDEQRELTKSPPGGQGLDITISLAQFDHEFEWVYRDKWLNETSEYTLVPRGSTALLDAIGRAVNEEGEHPQPAKVVLVITTDGYENFSREWTFEQVSKLLDQKKADGWEIVFLAGSLESAKMSKAMGLRTTQYTPDKEGTQAVYAAVTEGTTSYLSGKTKHVDMPDQV